MDNTTKCIPLSLNWKSPTQGIVDSIDSNNKNNNNHKSLFRNRRCHQHDQHDDDIDHDDDDAAACSHGSDGSLLLIIAHRGASDHIPEHSLPAYRLALELGANYIEPDVVATADGVLVAMHDLDLNVTTNIDDAVPKKGLPTWSNHANRSGYWIYNYRYDEIADLTLRQRLPKGRTTALDGLFHVPRLEEIVQLLLQWNTIDLPLRLNGPIDSMETPEGSSPRLNEPNGSDGRDQPTWLELHQSGIYPELKDVAWLLEAAGLDLPQLLLNHFKEYQLLWAQLLPCYHHIHPEDYKVPGVVVQSFEMDALHDFHHLWQETFRDDIIPEPPYVFLSEYPDCWQDQFWPTVKGNGSLMVQGIGCDKQCLLNDQVLGKTFQLNAEERGIVLHPWTERPEKEFFGGDFVTSRNEIEYLYCKMGIHGVFTEAVTDAVLVAKLGCQNSDMLPSGSFDDSGTMLSTLSTVVLPFVFGVLVTLMIGACYQYQCRRQNYSGVPDPESDIVCGGGELERGYQDQDVSLNVAIT